MDGFWAGVTLMVLQIVAFIAIWRAEDVAFPRLVPRDLTRARVLGIGLSALGLFAGWPIPNTTGTTDIGVIASAVLWFAALVVLGQAFAVLAFMFARWFTRQYVETRRGHKTETRYTEPPTK